MILGYNNRKTCRRATLMEEKYNFYAYLDRMKYIRRWQLMRSMRDENIMEHSQSVSILAHALAVIHNELFPERQVDVKTVVLYAMYHETSEVLTGDLPTPIKYFNREICGAYKDMEKTACEKMLSFLPEGMRREIAPYVLSDENSEEYKIVKAADKFSAYIRCIEERKSGNNEFKKAEESIKEDLHARKMPEVEIFFERFIPAFELTLDELEGL